MTRWVPSAGTRELMVSLWYPAVRSGGPHAQYLTPEESALLLATPYEDVGTSFPDGRVTTRAACELPDRGEEFWDTLTSAGRPTCRS